MITIKEHNAILLEFKVRNKHLQKELEGTEKENKRYRKAMIEAREISSCCGATAEFILSEALEGEAQ